MQLNFIDGHLLNWIEAFAHDIERFAQTKFYQGIGFFAIGFAQTDSEFLEELVGEL